MKVMNKRAQFYLIGAIVIVAIIIGFAAVSNYAKKSDSVQIYDLGDEVGIEGGEVLDHGVNKGGEGMQNLFEGFLKDYQKHVGEDKRLVFVYGNEWEIIALIYSEEDISTLRLDLGSGTPSPISEIEEGYIEELSYESNGGVITIIIDSVPYEFELLPGENFYFILSQETDGEKHVVQG